MRLNSWLIASLLGLAASPLFAATQDNIQSFSSNITVNQDATADVNETIQIQANQKYFQHGLTRDISIANPKDYEIRSITVDGVPVSYHVKVSPNQLSIVIGEDNKLLPPGAYTYSINYHVRHAVHFGDSADELAWNITSDAWGLPIETTRATVQLPDSAKLLRYDAYINNMQRTDDITITQAEDGIFSVTTNRPLAPHQALSLFVSWPKGIVRVKSYSQTLEADVAANRVNKWELGITLLVLVYYLFFWFRLGRNLHDPHLMPLFQPPAGISAAAARYLTQMRFDERVLTVGILSLATKNYLRIDAEDATLTLHMNKAGSAKLSDEEEHLFKALFQEGDTLRLNKTNRVRLLHAKNTLRTTLKQAYEQLYFRSNRGYVRLGILLSLGAFIAPVLSAVQHFHCLMAVSGLGIFGYTLYRLGKSFLRSAVLANHITTLKHLSVAMIRLFALVAVFVIAVYTLSLFSNNIPPVTLVLLGLLLAINITFYHLMRSPTPMGRDILNQIEGFKLFFHTTEKLRFAALAPPDMTTDLLDRYIPYAIAMGEESAWGERMIQTTSRAPQSSHCPTWLTLHEKHPAPLRHFAFHLNALLMHALHEAGV